MVIVSIKSGLIKRNKPIAQSKTPLILLLTVLTIMVRLAGIEPTTPWFVAKYSIQLSYSRSIRILYNSFKRFLSCSKNLYG
jgi:hypothetical protein